MRREPKVQKLSKKLLESPCLHGSTSLGAMRRSGENWEDASCKAPSHSGCGSSKLLEQQLQSELDLPRVVRRIARRADSTKVRVSEVARTGDGYHTVAAEIRRVEVRVVKDVKHFCPELQGETLLDCKVLENGHVQPAERGPRHLS